MDRKKHRLDLLSSAAPSVLPTLKKSAYGFSVWLQDIARVTALKDLVVEITPVTLGGRWR